MGRGAWPVKVRRLHAGTSVWLGVLERPSGLEAYGRDRDGRWRRSTTDQAPADPLLQQLFEWLCVIGEEQGFVEVHGRWAEGPEVGEGR